MNNKEEQRPFPLSFLFGCPKAFQSRFSRLFVYLFAFIPLYALFVSLLIYSSSPSPPAQSVHPCHNLTLLPPLPAIPRY